MSSAGRPARWTAQDWPVGMSTLPLSSSFTHGRDDARAPKEQWRRDLREIAGLGFAAVELTDAWLPVADLGASRQDELRGVLQETSLDVVAMTVSRRSILDPVLGEENLAYAHRAVEAAAAFGTGVVCLGLHRPLTAAQRRAHWFWLEPGASDPADPETFERAVAGFRELGHHCADLGLQLSLEVYEDTLLGTVDGALRMIEAIGLDNVGLNPDVANLVRLHRPHATSWYEDFARLLPVSNYWHVKNYQVDHDPGAGAWFSAPTSLELGVLNYRALLQLALDCGFSGPLCCEHYGGDALGVGATNLAYLRRTLSLKIEEVVS
ncbi:sugar phosphate isomerase/epimerase family protein [Ornithinimicrobium sp. W1679]|uniref:sugar phosphate isomerase/epimerase family protein n=1 Tax=Ornithinimicrobium sp. W1679 TaxID=3418770 RepID=UPI003CFB4BDF